MARRFNLRTFFWIVACAAAIAWLVSPPQRPDGLPDEPEYTFAVLNHYGIEYGVPYLVALPFRLAVLSGVCIAFLMYGKMKAERTAKSKSK